MNLYQVTEIENEIEAIAAANGGEIPEDKFEAMVIAQTQAIDKIDNLCKFLRSLDLFSEAAKLEEARIYDQRKKADKISASIKKYLTPYVVSKGKLNVGTFTLSTRVSKAIVVTDESILPEKYFITKVVESKSVDRASIKTDVENDVVVPGAVLEIRDNLQIK